MSNAQFRRDYAAIIKKAGARAEMVVRSSADSLCASLLQRSPVGDPLQWLSLRPYVDLKTGKQKTVLKAPAGYVGGRFKNNWQSGIGAINEDTSAPPDKNGAGAMGRFRSAMLLWRPGQTIYMTNSLPYAMELEYGHSTQAPSGVVRLTVLEFQSKVRQAAEKIK